MTKEARKQNKESHGIIFVQIGRGDVNVKWPRRDGPVCRPAIRRTGVPAQVMNQR